jgi:NADH dehydrogenase (ubiquinone) 1 alpha subcomplex subunit 1
MARLHWLEAVLPLGIIAGMRCMMGNTQYFIHKAASLARMPWRSHPFL